ncbi:MAG: FMN-binding protein [Candidatus Aminicenantes bacterium]|nr:MAG: FMN-binding protein [Candidatus Aminicenantes bacterium]
MKKRALSVIYMFLITLFFASLVSAVKLMNDKRIERNQIQRIQQIILRVLEIPTQEQTSEQELSQLFADHVKEIDVEERTLYIGYEQDGQTIRGYALPVGGPGFWGPIQGMIGISPDATRVLGIAFFKHNETPGLGGRITESWFADQFKDLPLHPIEGDQNIFYLKPEGTAQASNELDAITGATNTSSAVEAFLNRELDFFLKELWVSVEEKE